MGLFEDLCKGPVIVVDDMIDVSGDPINRLIREIKSKKLPVLTYKSISEIRDELGQILFCNFFILDWRMIGREVAPPPEVQLGAEAEASSEQEVIELVKQIQKISLAPIFILSAYNPDVITSKLNSAGINTGGTQSVFVESKDTVCQSDGALISKIEDWIKGSPHIYLGKWWTNELLSSNAELFWGLHESNTDWPAWFYQSFKDEMEEPVLALRDILSQLILSKIDVSSLDKAMLDKFMDSPDPTTLTSLKQLYSRLVYTTWNIDKDVRPGDVFKEQNGDEVKYYLNIRAECDTTTRNRNPTLYLLEGKTVDPGDVYYDNELEIVVEKVNQLVMFLLDGKDIVVFDKRKLSTKKYNQIRNQKICRVVPPFITRCQQSFASYVGRFGVPTYPKAIIKSLFEGQND